MTHQDREVYETKAALNYNLARRHDGVLCQPRKHAGKNQLTFFKPGHSEGVRKNWTLYRGHRFPREIISALLPFRANAGSPTQSHKPEAHNMVFLHFRTSSIRLAVRQIGILTIRAIWNAMAGHWSFTPIRRPCLQ